MVRSVTIFFTSVLVDHSFSMDRRLLLKTIPNKMYLLFLICIYLFAFYFTCKTVTLKNSMQSQKNMEGSCTYSLAPYCITHKLDSMADVLEMFYQKFLP